MGQKVPGPPRRYSLISSTHHVHYHLYRDWFISNQKRNTAWSTYNTQKDLQQPFACFKPDLYLIHTLPILIQNLQKKDNLKWTQTSNFRNITTLAIYLSRWLKKNNAKKHWTSKIASSHQPLIYSIY